MGLQLFDGRSSSDDDASEIKINKEFARRYEHNKNREDLQRLEELKKKGLVEDSSNSDSEESSEESSDHEELTDSRKDLEFFDALLKVRNQDPVLKEGKLFESESESGAEDENNGNEKKRGKMGKKKEKKPMYLKDVVSKHLIEEGPEFEDKEDKTGGIKSYSEEQEELRKAFLDAAEEASDNEGNFLKVKEKGGEDDVDEDGEEFGKKLNEYFGEDEKLDENMMFLKDYFKNRMWVGEDKGKKGLDEGDELEFSEDEEEIERQEDYERGFNFRFEENMGDRVYGHSRIVDGSVRKKTNARKSQRERKEERMALAELERKEELKHLKNLKKKEINEKLKKIRETAGIGEDGSCPLDEDYLEEEFDPLEFDKKMKEAFNENYYEGEDVDPDFGSDDEEKEKPDFDQEDELLGLPKGWDDASGPSDGFLATREIILKRKADNGDNGKEAIEEEEEEEENEEETVPVEGKRKKKRKMSSVEKALRGEWLEEYYKLDYEDTIEDLKTRFKYKSVNPRRFGLSAEEIIMMDEKELNQYVSLKKLAPYREKEWKVPRMKIHNQKQRNKDILQGKISKDQYASKTLSTGYSQKPITHVDTDANEKETEDTKVDKSNPSRKSRRKHRQADLKLSLGRLMAYGKLSSKAKSKKKA